MLENKELAVVLKLVADQYQTELKKSSGVTGEFTKFITDWKTQLTAAGAALFSVAKSTANYGDELVKMSQRLGTTIQDTARLRYAASLSDTDLRGLSTTVGFLSKNMLEAAQGNKEAQQKFRELGVSVTGTNGQLKGTTEILVEISNQFRLMPDGPEKTALAMQVLGKSAKEVLPFLNSNLKEAFQEAEQFGLVMDTKAAKAAEHFNDELTKLQASIRGVTNDLGNALIPKFDAMAHALTTIITDAREAARALAGLNKIEAEQPGTVMPEGGGRRLRILPAPSGEATKGFSTQPFFKTPEQAAAAEQVLAEQRKKHATEQERLGKAKLDLFLMQNRALEYQAKLESEKEDAAIEEAKGRAILKMTQEQLEGLKQEQLGRQIIQQTQAQLAIDEARRTEEMTAQEQLGRQIVQQTQAQLAIEEARRLSARNFFDEWADGMKRYVQDTKTGLGLGADMARRTFQTMEQFAGQFFFDVMDARIKSLKDVFESLLQFVKRIISQIVAQLVIQQAVRFAMAWPGAAPGANAAIGVPGYSPVSGFAAGGPVRGIGDGDTVPALLTPGEYVLSRDDVRGLKRGMGGGNTVNITINTSGGRQEAGAGSSNWTQMARELGKLVEAKLVDEQRPGGLLAGGRA